MTTEERLLMYEMSLNVLVRWQAHSLSNAGSNGSIRLLPRRQCLADGTETDACSGNILKHHHAELLAEYQEELGIPLCPACAGRDGRRIAALYGQPGYEVITIERALSECGMCDAEGFLLPAKKAANDGSTSERSRVSKASLVEFSFALGRPDHCAETVHFITRSGDRKDDGQMLMKVPGRSGEYALCVRYKSVGVGVDTNKWNVVVGDEAERLRRHRAILLALRDQLLSPSGALTATMLPHLSGLAGAIVIRDSAGRAPIYSALETDFVTRLTALAGKTCRVLTFHTVDEFNELMNWLIESSVPRLPTPRPPVQARP